MINSWKTVCSQTVATGCKIVKKPSYDNLIIEKDGYIKNFSEDCVEWILKEMLEKEKYMKNYSKDEIMIYLKTISENSNGKVNSANHADSTNKCWLCEKEIKKEVEFIKSLFPFLNDKTRQKQSLKIIVI